MKTVTIDAMEYWQPECRCTGGGHICYLRPMPQKVNVPIDVILSKLGAPSGTRDTRAKAKLRSELASKQEKEITNE